MEIGLLQVCDHVGEPAQWHEGRRMSEQAVSYGGGVDSLEPLSALG